MTAGCAYVPQRSVPAHPLPLPAELASYYDYPKQPINATREMVRDHAALREFFIRFPLSVSGFEPTEPVVEVEWFESKQLGRRPAILFNPILGGDYPLERGICRFFASHGFHVAMIHRKTLKISPEHDASRLELLLRQGVLRIRQVVDWMETQEGVDPRRLGSFGLSMGGIASVMAAAVEPRLRTHVVGLAGGSIADILLMSKDSLLTKPLNRYLERQQLDRAALERLLEEQVKTDPIRLAPYVDSRQLFLFIALADRTIGRANALRLWRALGRPQVVFLPTGHYTSYFFLPYVKRVSLRFFQRHLAAP
ncbi:MAG: prolyl oligopeptidase family serine peptidase [Candidatus Omnitrophica bacterium]|nr:prolyl oligopeptidase family serine peptidase [Candidatus Omnitrophota bacterium]